ncbi:MAG TPA: hypothetical protein VJI69_09635 [Bacteroidia bacterium]|nr:hypothetical protein [Bacteroidia bacterium]
METFFSILFNPITIAVVGFIIVLGIMLSPYEIYFDDKDEMDF